MPEKLGRLAPNASHLIRYWRRISISHMGRYEDAAIVNASAMRIDSDHLEETKTTGGLSGALWLSAQSEFRDGRHLDVG